jgi:D-alanine-D-alanine ligase
MGVIINLPLLKTFGVITGKIATTFLQMPIANKTKNSLDGPGKTAVVNPPNTGSVPLGSKQSKPSIPPRPKLSIDQEALKKLRLVAVTYPRVDYDKCPNGNTPGAELGVEEQAHQMIAELEKLGIPAHGYPGDQYFLSNLLIDQPDLALILINPAICKDELQTSIPAALELAEIPYTGAGMNGQVISDDRNMVKQLLLANHIPTPAYQLIRRRGAVIDETLELPLIVKLNQSGGRVGIDRHAIKETYGQAHQKVDQMIATYNKPVVVEHFIDGPEITVIIFEDSQQRHIFMGEKVYEHKLVNAQYAISTESNDRPASYHYRLLNDDRLVTEISHAAEKAYVTLHNRDYAKFDLRLDLKSGIAYFIDANPNAAFGPGPGQPFTEVLDLYNISFAEVLASLLSKYAQRL